MKTQIQRPVSGKSRYTAEFKEEALARWRQSGRSAAKMAAELGIRAPLLYRWATQQRLAAQQGSQPLLPKPERVTEMQAEIDRLRAENAKAEKGVKLCSLHFFRPRAPRIPCLHRSTNLNPDDADFLYCVVDPVS